MPRMTVPQFMLGFVLGVVGYPFSLTLSASIFSKVVGDINPGYWLGLFNTFGSTARVIGPLLVTEVYQELGTYAMTFLVISVLVSYRLDIFPKILGQEWILQRGVAGYCRGGLQGIAGLCRVALQGIAARGQG